MTSRKDQQPERALELGAVERPLLGHFPRLASAVQFLELATLPTPCEPLPMPEKVNSGAVYVKRDDLSAPAYGGNKVRTLEVLFGQASREGYTRVVSTGAFGSNHAVATIVHGRRAGFETGALLCPQPPSRVALENLRVTALHADRFTALPHWSCLPLGMSCWRLLDRGAFVMPPGGATPQGALGYVSAAFELAQQVRAGVLPAPARIVLPVGSTCTSAGLLLGLRLVQTLGLGFEQCLPLVYSVRVTPWPVASAWRITQLAARTARWLAGLVNAPQLAFERKVLATGLHVDGRFLGPGYGLPTREGADAVRALGRFGQTLDPTYSAKAAAALLELAGEARGVTLFWATKSSAALPAVDAEHDARLPRSVRAWIRRAEQAQPG